MGFALGSCAALVYAADSAGAKRARKQKFIAAAWTPARCPVRAPDHAPPRAPEFDLHLRSLHVGSG
jgi:hypothetical protein